MIVTNLASESELLVDYNGLKRTRKVNGDYSLSFAILKTDKNEHSFALVDEESIVEYDGQQYRIKDVTEVLIGVTPIKTVQAFHIFFDLVDTYKYDYLENTQHLQSCLTFALDGTGYTFEVIDSFPSAVFEKFGEDNSLSLVQKVLNVFGAEVQLNNKHLKFYRQIGTDTEIQVRYGYNVKTLEKYVNTNNLSTRIRGFGKKNEDGSYLVTAEYISPMAAVYGVRDAKPIYDERYTIHSELLERIKSELIDEPQVSFKVDALELKKMGVLTEQLNEGDRVFVIYEPLGIDLIARVLEIVDYPESSKPAEYTFGNFSNSLTSEIVGFQKTKDNVDALLNGEKKLPYNVLDDAVLRATESLLSAATELIFDNGIIAQDPSNPNRLVLINSKGIGISDNGGATFREAITADGFVLSAGAIGQLKANNIDIGDVINNINGGSTQISGGVIKITDNNHFNSVSDTASSANKTANIANSAANNANQVASNAQSTANSTNNQVNLWKYPGTTYINGGNIYTNSILANAIKAGILTGFVIQTDSSPYVPRVYMGGSKLEVTNADGGVTIDARGWSNYAGLTIRSGNTNLIIQAYDNRASITGADELEIWTPQVGIYGSLDVQGAKNATVPTPIGNVNVSAYETAEYYFGDIGRGKIAEGKCTVNIELLFKETVNTNIDYEVFLTPYGRGVIYVDPDEMKSNQFIVRGDDIPFAYEIKAKRLGYEDVRLELTHESGVDEIVQNASQK